MPPELRSISFAPGFPPLSLFVNAYVSSVNKTTIRRSIGAKSNIDAYLSKE